MSARLSSSSLPLLRSRLHLLAFLLRVPYRPRPRPDTPSGRGRGRLRPQHHKIQAVDVNSETGFPSSQALASGRGWRLAMQGCKKDPAGMEAAFGTELRFG